jgi:N-acetylmuramoyl-L-alanine amidase
MAAVLIAALAAIAATASSDNAQPSLPTPTRAPSVIRNLILLDPAHGGPDSGATLGDRILEKDVNLAFAARLRAALTSAGFTVISTRDADPADLITTDQRADTANRAHPVACIVLHATATGSSGVHLYTSTLQPASENDDTSFAPAFVPIPWDTAQAGSVQQSLRLAGDLSAVLGRASLPALTGQAPLRPLDNLICPAVALELAPLVVAGSDATPVTDTGYQQRVASTVAAALKTWRDQAYPPPGSAQPPSAAQSPGGAQ